jgi:microcystin-dependent protein
MACKGGQSTVALITNQIPAHNHTIPAHGHGNNIVAKTPSLSHSITQAKFTYTQIYGTADDAQSGSSNYYNGRTSTAMTRSADLAVANHAATACTMSGGVTDCAAFDSENTGGDGAHNNLMPYLALTYLIRYAPDVPPEPPTPKMYLFNGSLPVSAGGAYICGMTR